MSSARADTPSPTWLGAERVAVRCFVTGADADAISAALCEQVRTQAARGAPAGITVLSDDSDFLKPDVVTLLVHGAVLPASAAGAPEPGRFLAFSIRPFRNASGDVVLYGTAPAAVPLPPSGLDAARLGEAVGRALSQTLPWASPPSGARPLAG